MKVMPRLLEVRGLFGLLDGIRSDSESLCDRWFEKSLKNMNYYEAEMSKGLEAVQLLK